MTEAEQGAIRSDYRVLIVGCGQLGSRHLQAVARLPEVKVIEVVDPRPAALELGRERLSEISERSPSTTVRWLSSLQEATAGGDLCVDATLARGRCQRVREVAEGLGYQAFLLEKVVSQSVREMENLAEFFREKGLRAWVNCKGRAHRFHLRAKKRVDPSDPVIFTVVGGNHGLATNGIHAADLFMFYDGTRSIESAGSRIDPVLHPSKRGADVFDLSGTLNGYTEKGSLFSLTYAPDHQYYEHFSIATRRYRCFVDQLKGWAIESDANSGWAWREVPFDGPILVSEMTTVFAADILASGGCDLPTLPEALVAHRYVLNELQPHFNRLMDRDLDSCPVT